MKNATSTRLFAYWNEIRGPRMAPHRFEVEPSRIADILAQTFILERDADGKFRFRLAGTQICEHFGREFRGQDILNLWTGEDRVNFERVLRGTAFEGAVGVVAFDAKAMDGSKVSLELMLLPLVHNGNAITRLMGCISPDKIAPGWLGTIPLSTQKISRVSIIWPDGHPHAVIARTEQQLPFSQVPGPKRVVSIDRRSFRVFEGGRSDAAPQAQPHPAQATDAPEG